jgi:hypothetical protein
MQPLAGHWNKKPEMTTTVPPYTGPRVGVTLVIPGVYAEPNAIAFAFKAETPNCDTTTSLNPSDRELD